jgi:hypothetical protein
MDLRSLTILLFFLLRAMSVSATKLLIPMTGWYSKSGKLMVLRPMVLPMLAFNVALTLNGY